MPIKYSKNEIIDRIENIIRKKHLSVLYKEPYIKRKGKTKECEFYSEVASQELLNKDIKRLLDDQIGEIPRGCYKVIHTGKINKNSNRDEEILAISLKGKDLSYLGHVLEYQIPLKSKNSDKGVGKIDLVSVNGRADKAVIVELKAKDNKEGLLRAILEIATYERQLNMDTFRRDIGIPREALIAEAVLLENGSQGCIEAYELSKRPHLCNLIKHLGIEIFILKDRGRLDVESINICSL